MSRCAPFLMLLMACGPATPIAGRPGGHGGGGGTGPPVEICDNGKDDDGDGQADCADADCAGSPHCPFCGDGLRQDPEVCDGTDLAGSSCALQHFEGGGSLGCKSDCTFDTSACIALEDCSTPGDEDGNGSADCADSACATLDSCLQLLSVDPPRDAVVTSARTLAVIVTDGTGSPVAGKAVRLVPPPGAAGPDAPSSSDHDGVARFEIRLGRKAGLQTFVARLDPGSASVSIPVAVVDVAAGNIHTVVNVDRGAGTDGTGPAITAHLASLVDLAVARDDTLYLAEPCRILRVSPEGVLSVLAGNGSCGSAEDGSAALQTPLSVSGLALDEDRNRVLFVDSWADTVRSLDLGSGIIDTVAGGGTGKDGDPARGAALVAGNLALAPDGTIYVSDTLASSIRRVGVDGIISTALASDDRCGGELSMQSCRGSWCRPLGDDTGALFVFANLCGSNGGTPLSGMPGLVRILPGGGPLTRIAGFPGGPSPSGLGATLTALSEPFRATFDPAGNLFALSGSRLMRIDDRSWVATSVVSWDAAVTSGENAPLGKASFAAPSALAFAPDGDLYVADGKDATVRRIVGLGQKELPRTLAAIADRGDSQSVDLCQKPSDPLVVRVLDDDKPVSGLPVTFSADDAGIELYPGRQTDADGRLSREVRLGMVSGEHQVVASIADIHGTVLPGPVTFHLTATEPPPGTIFSLTGADGIDNVHLDSLDAGPPVPACPAHLTPNYYLAVAPDGAVFAPITKQQIVMVSKGTLQLFGGVSNDGILSDGDGGPALQARLRPGPMAATNETVYFWDAGGDWSFRTIDRATGIVNKLTSAGYAMSLMVDTDGSLLAGMGQGIVRIDPVTGATKVLVPSQSSQDPCPATGVSLISGVHGLARLGDDIAFSGSLCKDGMRSDGIGIAHPDGTVQVLTTFYSPTLLPWTDGNLLIESSMYLGVLDLATGGWMSDVAGGGVSLRDDVPARQSSLERLGEMHADSQGHVYVSSDDRIRVVW